MGSWKSYLLYGAAALLLLLLYPAYHAGRRPAAVADVQEVKFMGPGWACNDQSLLDAILAFEEWSRERHAKNPRLPAYKVVVGQDAQQDYDANPTRFLVSVAGGSPPDVMWFGRHAVAELAAKGAFEPLDGYIARDLAAGQRDPLPPTHDQFYHTCWAEGSYQEKTYCIPNSVDSRALIYNKDLLARAGLVDARGKAKPPANWEELRDYALILTEWEPRKPTRPTGVSRQDELSLLRALARGTAIDRLPAGLAALNNSYLAKMDRWHRDPSRRLTRIGFIPNYGNAWLYFYAWMNGGEFATPDGARITMNDPRNVEALQFMKDIYDDLGGYPAVLAFQSGFQGGELDPFIQGKLAMRIDIDGMVAGLANFGRDVNFGVCAAPLPQREIDRRRRENRPALLSWSGGFGYAIPATARNKMGGWEFIRFMTSEKAILIACESGKALAEANGRIYVPPQQPRIAVNNLTYHKYVLDNPRLPERFKEAMNVYNGLLPYSQFRPVLPVGQQLWTEHVRAVENAMYPEKTGMTPRTALDAGTRTMQRELDKYLHPPPGKRVTTWQWFFILYALLFAVIVACIYLLETRANFRRRLARLPGLSRLAAREGIGDNARALARREWWGGISCALPWIIGFLIFGGGPMLFSLIISFTDYDILHAPVMTGARNYVLMFTEDKQFPVSLWNSAFMLFGVPLGMAVSLAIALLLQSEVRGIAAWRTLFYLPAIVPMVAASILWLWIFNPQSGLLNGLLDALHIRHWLVQALSVTGVQGDVRWLQDPLLSKPSIIIMGLWGAGGGMIIWLAGLKAIPHELYEAASVDGANEWVKLWRITIPQLTPYIFFNLIMGLIGTFQIFGQAFIMTQGGPADSTLFYVYHLFNNAFRYGKMGYASALAWVLFAIVLALTIVQVKWAKRWVYYEAE